MEVQLQLLPAAAAHMTGRGALERHAEWNHAGPLGLKVISGVLVGV